MKLPLDPRLPILTDEKIRPLTQRLNVLFRQFANYFNDSFMWDTNGTTSPTSGPWYIGNKCRNNEPAEAGTSSSKYVVIGWVCTASGTPGTWLEIRTLTGN